MQPSYNLLFKFLLIGDSGVGKSNLMMRFTSDEFNPEPPSTIGVEFMTRGLSIEGQDVKVQIWDTAGQERFRAICRTAYNGAKGVMVVYDITSQLSFEHIQTWLDDVIKYVPPSAVIMLIGNKCDLEADREVPAEAGQKFAEEKQLLFLETSALDATNVDKAFEWLAREICQRTKKEAPKVVTSSPPDEAVATGGQVIHLQNAAATATVPGASKGKCACKA